MTTIVKKRLQAVVALLVCFMVLFAALPADVFDGIFNMTVHAADNVTIYFDTGQNNYNSPSNAEVNNVSYSFTTSWTNSGVMYYRGSNDSYATHAMTLVSNKVGAKGGEVYTATIPLGTTVYFLMDPDWPTNSGYDPCYRADQSIDVTISANRVYYVQGIYGTNNQSDTGKRNIDSYDASGLSDPQPQTTSDKSILVGVKYYNYFYDEQIEYEKVNGTADPTKLKVTDGQAKNPYTYFNRAVMASDYGGNNVKGRTSNNPTSYPVMYLGEFWLGGGAENNGSGYESAPTVSAGKYDRSDGVTSGDISRGSRTLQDEDRNYSKSVSISVQNDTLTNFYWGANLAARGSNSAQQYYHIVAQGLVDDTLSMDPTSPNYLVPTINGQRIPYFDEKFLYASTNGDLASITGNKDVGHVYTSIFPFYRKDVEFTTNTDFTKSAWHNSWIREGCSGDNWGRSLTAGTISTKSEYYTFNSKTDTVSVNPDGGATSDPGDAAGGYGTTNWDKTLQQVANANNEFTQDNLDALVDKYSVANYNAVGDTNRPIIEGHLNGEGGDYVEQIAQHINTYKNGSMFDDDEVALLTIAGFFDNTGADAGHVKDVDGQYGYFPFNSSSDSLKQLQYGFGTRLDIRFNISKDGLTTESAPEIFRFTGDDDVWVFIDGKLVLDMGGGHKNAIGEINFNDCKAAVLFAGDAQTNDIWAGSDMSSMVTNSGTGISTDSNGITTYGPTSEIGQLLTNIKNEAAGGISEDHTLTMFYMERGKLNSNMSVMFNFKAPDIIDITNPTKDFPATPQEYPDPNPVTTSKLKIREITNIENVNPGLVTPTMKAAENDAFRYAAITNVVRSSSWPVSKIFTPTRNTYERDPGLGDDYKTTLSSSSQPSGATGKETYSMGSADYVLIVSGLSGHKEYGIYEWWSGSNAMHLGVPIGENVYAFYNMHSSSGSCLLMHSDTEGIIVDGGTCAGEKLTSDNQTYDTNYFYSYSSSGSGSLIQGSSRDIHINDFGNIASGDKNLYDVNYIWNSAFTSQTNTSSVGYVGQLTNTTTDTGTFTLLYGTSDEESSALFKNQFYNVNTSPATTSMLKVTQSLAARDTSEHDVNSYVNSSRSVSKYYTTDVSTIKRVGGVATVDTTPTASSLSSSGVLVDVPDMDIIISNYINVANVYVRKENLTYQDGSAPVNTTSSPEIENDEYSFKVYLWDVFGEAGNHVTDYTKVKYVIDENDANQISMLEGADSVTETKYGILKVKAGETAKIMGIPEGTICIIDEMHESKNFDNSTSEKQWADEYNLNNPSRNPTITTKIMTDQQTEQSQNLPPFVQNIASLTLEGTIYAWQVNGSQSNPAYKRALYSAKNTVKNPDPSFQAKQITLIVEKIWDTTETLEETSVKFVVQRQTVADSNGTLSSDESAWTAYNYDSNHDDGVVTLTSGYLVGGSNPIKWRKTITTSAPDKPDENHTYYYRIREWGKDDAVFVYKDGGFYSENFKAVYGAGTQESPVTNIGSGNVGDGTASPAISYSYKTVETTSDGQPTPTYTYTLTLQIKNEYRSTTIDPKPLPKTGARGVYAIVTFGAFAITIAGVALLIYRKKLQTVNIYAVKGSEKPKE